MGSRWSRVVRGLLAATFATGTAAVSHALAGGTISAVGIGVALAFATVVSVALTGGRPSVGRLAASVTVSQLGFHTMFSYLGDGATVVTHGHHSLIADATAATHLDASMWFGHAVAAALTLVVLHHGERAFWRLADLLFVRLRLTFTLATPATPLLSAFSPLTILRSIRERSSVLYRGPPVSLVF